MELIEILKYDNPTLKKRKWAMLHVKLKPLLVQTFLSIYISFILTGFKTAAQIVF